MKDMEKELTPLPLDALDELKRQGLYGNVLTPYGVEEDTKIIETALKQKETDAKEKKAFEIIRNKEVDVSWFKYCLQRYENALKHYNEFSDIKLTVKEFKLLKEVL